MRHIATNFRIFKIACFYALFAATSALAEIRVGVVSGLSGEMAAYGKAYQDGIALAQEKFPAAKVTFIYEDDQFVPRLSVQAARKLIALDKVETLIIGDTNTAKAVAQAVPASIPLYVWASEHANFNRPNIIRAWPREEKEISVMVENIRRDALSKIALLTSSHEYTLGWARGLKQRLGEDVIYYEEFAADLDDYRSLLLKLKGLGVQSLGLCLTNPKNGQLAREASDLRLGFKLFGCNFLQSTTDLVAARGALNGAWYMDTPVSPSFKAAYIAKTGGTDYLNAAAVMYDIATVILKSSEKGIGIPQFPALNPIAGANGAFNIRNDAGTYFDFDFVRLNLG